MSEHVPLPGTAGAAVVAGATVSGAAGAGIGAGGAGAAASLRMSDVDCVASKHHLNHGY